MNSLQNHREVQGKTNTFERTHDRGNELVNLSQKIFCFLLKLQGCNEADLLSLHQFPPSL